ncbi:MAG TPA: hypothetical protein VEW93_08915 [Acidimicrobiales bacterium]|nr:hypothetical protein [Acidimicrobiales bacterium]
MTAPLPLRTPVDAVDRGSLATYTWVRSALVVAHHRLAGDDRGEGVISAAIVVLITAFLGAAMWTAFKLIFDDAATNTRTEVNKIGD